MRVGRNREIHTQTKYQCQHKALAMLGQLRKWLLFVGVFKKFHFTFDFASNSPKYLISRFHILPWPGGGGEFIQPLDKFEKIRIPITFLTNVKRHRQIKLRSFVRS